MDFRAGDRVRFMDFECDGFVKSVGDGFLVIESEGMVMRVKPSEVVPVGSENPDEEQSMYAANNNVSGFKPVPSYGRRRVKKCSGGRMRNDTMEVDLHIEKIRSIYPAARNVQDNEILPLQLSVAEDSIAEAYRKGIKTLVLIHGNGRGVLRSELERLLRNYPGITYRDASAFRYGTGALEVTIG